MFNLSTINGRLAIILVLAVAFLGVYFFVLSPAKTIAQCDARAPGPIRDLNCIAGVLESCPEEDGFQCFATIAAESEKAVEARLRTLTDGRIYAAASRADESRRKRIEKLSRRIDNIDADRQDCDDDPRAASLGPETREAFCGALLGIRLWINVRMLESDVLRAERS